MFKTLGRDTQEILLIPNRNCLISKCNGQGKPMISIPMSEIADKYPKLSELLSTLESSLHLLC